MNPLNLLSRWLQLLLGLTLLGVGIAVMLSSSLGLGPWDMLHQGLSRQVGLSVGRISQLVGGVILLLLLLVRVWPGLGTVMNIWLIGEIIDLTLPRLPHMDGLALRTGVFISAIFISGMGTGMYIGARLGAGPRDSLMLWLSRRTGWAVRRVRTIIEVCVLAGGFLLGGTIGAGTLLFAFGIGPATQLGLSWFDRRPRPGLPPVADGTGLD